MPRIHVHTAFNLLLSHTSGQQHFEPGVQDVSTEVAQHWYTKEHSSVVEAEAEQAPAKAKRGSKAKVEAEAEQAPADDGAEANEGGEGDASDNASGEGQDAEAQQ